MASAPTREDALFGELQTEIKALSVRYIDKHLPADPTATPDTFEHDVKAYCVMCHAAFEEYIELVSEYLMARLEKQFLRKEITQSTLMFVMTYGSEKIVDAFNDKPQVRAFDVIRTAIAEGKAAHSKRLIDNHGFSLQYMRKILIPVGLAMPSGPKIDSLGQLADARGSFAHSIAKGARFGKERSAKSVLVPEDAVKIVGDCLEIADSIRGQVKALW